MNKSEIQEGLREKLREAQRMQEAGEPVDRLLSLYARLCNDFKDNGMYSELTPVYYGIAYCQRLSGYYAESANRYKEVIYMLTHKNTPLDDTELHMQVSSKLWAGFALFNELKGTLQKEEEEKQGKYSYALSIYNTWNIDKLKSETCDYLKDAIMWLTEYDLTMTEEEQILSVSAMGVLAYVSALKNEPMESLKYYDEYLRLYKSLPRDVLKDEKQRKYYDLFSFYEALASRSAVRLSMQLADEAEEDLIQAKNLQVSGRNIPEDKEGLALCVVLEDRVSLLEILKSYREAVTDCERIIRLQIEYGDYDDFDFVNLLMSSILRKVKFMLLCDENKYDILLTYFCAIDLLIHREPLTKRELDRLSLIYSDVRVNTKDKHNQKHFDLEERIAVCNDGIAELEKQLKDGSLSDVMPLVKLLYQKAVVLSLGRYKTKRAMNAFSKAIRLLCTKGELSEDEKELLYHMRYERIKATRTPVNRDLERRALELSSKRAYNCDEDEDADDYDDFEHDKGSSLGEYFLSLELLKYVWVSLMEKDLGIHDGDLNPDQYFLDFTPEI